MHRQCQRRSTFGSATLFAPISWQNEMTTLEELGDLEGAAGARVDNDQPRVVD